jgi:hypothetical protein
MYRRRIDQKYIDKIHADYLSKQPRIFRRHLAINYRFTNFDVVKIK